MRQTNDERCATAVGRRPRLLVVAPYPVLPATTGGKIRIVQLVRNLARRGIDATVMTPYKPGQRRHISPDEPFRLIQVKYPFVLPLLFTDRPFPYGYLVSVHPGLCWMLRKLMGAYDVVQFEHAHFADLLDVVPVETPVVYNAHNVEFDYISCECRHKAVQVVAGSRILALEGRLARAASRILTCSHEDERRLCELYGVSTDKCSLAPNGIREIRVGRRAGDAAAVPVRLPGLGAFPKRAIFSGSNVEHNRQAVRSILECIAPGCPDWAFIIHGAAGKSFRHVELPNVFLDPRANGMDRYAEIGTVGLNPVTMGSGTSLKFVHYLAHGMPVVSTPFGMRGVADLEPFVTVCPVAEFVDALGSGPPPSDGVEPKLERYLWNNVAQGIEQVYSSLVGAPAAPSDPV